MNVKRFGLRVAGIGVLVSIGLLTVEQGYTEEKQRATKCTRLIPLSQVGQYVV
jgi:hypothetical protein